MSDINLILDKTKIAERLREFGVKKFGTIKDFAFNLDMKPSSLQSAYLSGRSIPGPELLMKLYMMGCDIIWLLRGKDANYTKEGFNQLVNDTSVLYRGITKEDILKKENEELKEEIKLLRKK